MRQRYHVAQEMVADQHAIMQAEGIRCIDLPVQSEVPAVYVQRADAC